MTTNIRYVWSVVCQCYLALWGDSLFPVGEESRVRFSSLADLDYELGACGLTRDRGQIVVADRGAVS